MKLGNSFPSSSQVMVENSGKHLSAEEVYELVKEKTVSIGLATVYRNLNLLSEKGILTRRNFQQSSNFFTLYEHMIKTKEEK